MITISELNIYPVKSLGGQTLQQAAVDRFGLQGDRRWLVVDPAGRFLTQREVPQMATIRAQQQAHGLLLQYGDDTLELKAPSAATPELEVEVWADRVGAQDAGAEPAQWLSERLQRDCRLVYMSAACQRLVDPDYARSGQTVSFADGFPLLLIAEASLTAFNMHLEVPIAMNQFRPNLVVRGADAYAEDSWRNIKMGNLEFALVKPCSRCVMPSIDQATGTKHPEVLKALSQHRRGADRKTYFGQNLLYTGTGSLAVGDTVTILS